MAEKEKRLSLDEALESEDTSLHNSHMKNLASALLRIKKHRLLLDKYEDQLRQIAENPASSLDEVQDIYRKVMDATDAV